MTSSISSLVEGTSVLSSFTVRTISTISARAAGRSKWISPLSMPCRMISVSTGFSSEIRCAIYF